MPHASRSSLRRRREADDEDEDEERREEDEERLLLRRPRGMPCDDAMAMRAATQVVTRMTMRKLTRRWMQTNDETSRTVVT